MRVRPLVLLPLTLLSTGHVVAQGGDAITVRAVPGQAYEGFLLAPGETHAYELEGVAPQPITVSLKALKGSSLEPDVTLEDPLGADVTASLDPYRKDSSSSLKVKGAPFPSGAGRYVLRVLGKNGSFGTYSLKVSTKPVKSFRGEGFVPGSSGSDLVRFFAPAESAATLTIKPTDPGNLAPVFLDVATPDCLGAKVVPSATRTGVGTLAILTSGDHAVRIGGGGDTAGAFRWTVKVKPSKASRVPIRVNAGAPSFPDPGPSSAKLFTSPGQAIAGFEADGLVLAWREYRTQGNPQQSGKNSIVIATLKGAKETKLANNFATDGNPEPRAFALGPTHVAVVAEGALHAVPRAGGQIDTLDPAAGAVVRVLCDEENAFYLRADGLFAAPLVGGGASALPSAPGTLVDAVLGGPGILYAVETPGGALEIRSMTRAGESDALVTAFEGAPGLLAMAVRGPDAFVALDDGVGGSTLLRVPVCGGDPRELLSGGPIFALATDDLFVYVLEDDSVDGLWVRQVPRGGGLGTVLVRESGDGSFTIDASGLAAAGGWVYLLGVDGGSLGFWRTKRR